MPHSPRIAPLPHCQVVDKDALALFLTTPFADAVWQLRRPTRHPAGIRVKGAYSPDADATSWVRGCLKFAKRMWTLMRSTHSGKTMGAQ